MEEEMKVLTAEEAAYELELECCHEQDCNLCTALKMGAEALRKQMSVKPLYMLIDYDYFNRYEYVCPICSSSLLIGDNYCFRCGHELDWSIEIGRVNDDA